MSTPVIGGEVEARRRLAQLETELLPAARAKARAAHLAYAATPNGMAELARRWELSAGQMREQMGELLAAAVAAADQEYRERIERGNHSDTDGWLRPVLLPGTDDELTQRLIAGRIMGTFRHSVSAQRAGATRVRIHRLSEDGVRSSVSVTYPKILEATNTQVSLRDVVVVALQDRPSGWSRLTKLVGADECVALAGAGGCDGNVGERQRQCGAGDAPPTAAA